MKCPKCDAPMTLFGSKIYEGAMICNDCYEKLSSAPKQQETPPPQIKPVSQPASFAMSQQHPRRTPSGINLATRRDSDLEDNFQIQPQSEPLQQNIPIAESVRSPRKRTQQEEMTPLTPAKITGLIKAQKAQKILEQQQAPQQKGDGFTPARPDQFSGLFGSTKKEEFIEPREREEEFTAMFPEKFTGYKQEKTAKNRTMESNLAETVGKFVGPATRPTTHLEEKDYDEYPDRQAIGQRRKLPNLGLLPTKPLTPIRQQEQKQPQVPDMTEEIYQGMNMLYQRQEQLENMITELSEKVDYQTQLLEEIYRALGQYLSGEY